MCRDPAPARLRHLPGVRGHPVLGCCWSAGCSCAGCWSWPWWGCSARWACSSSTCCEYQKERLTAFIDPGADDGGQGFTDNSRQALIAIGSGGVGGKGYLRGTQTNPQYVPEQKTDFIFTVIGEELGFAGAMALLALLGLLLWRGLRIAAVARDQFGALLAAGVVAMLAFQAFVNIGMTVGIMPITGIPLPFVSYGGSSLVATFLAVGLLENVHMRR
ncbi:MAG TPA: FtsW/RodA/SpoVE family cell cycle protein [Actinomycetes bacterium]|nr:FtsW/RodA/SpoVE family cell cycle protein [Actinomycetes bacterium]